MTTADVAASNGVIHVIDKVLVPPGVLNVVQMAQLNPTFSVLVEAVVAANLATTLSGTGPFTVFAPTNDAFTAALAELGADQGAAAGQPGAGRILTYHVVAGDVRAADVVALPKPASVTTCKATTFTVGADLGHHRRRARSANLVATDVIASNGVIHVIDKVHPARALRHAPASLFTHSLNPRKFTMKKLLALSALSLAALSAQAKDIVDTAVAAGNFKTLAAALTAAGLVDTLKGKGPFTVFAPTDEAFAKIPKADLDALLADKAKLTAVLTYHVVAGKVMAKDVKAGKVKTVQGGADASPPTGGVTVDGAKVTATDIVADNGVIHVIDSVVLPK